jgi:hypothetical protein
VREQSQKFALRFKNTDDPAEKIGAMYRFALQRPASAEEMDTAMKFVKVSGADGFIQLAQALLAGNSFQFID